jgi:hypothetical protein
LFRGTRSAVEIIEYCQFPVHLDVETSAVVAPGPAIEVSVAGSLAGRKEELLDEPTCTQNCLLDIIVRANMFVLQPRLLLTLLTAVISVLAVRASLRVSFATLGARVSVVGVVHGCLRCSHSYAVSEGEGGEKETVD